MTNLKEQPNDKPQLPAGTRSISRTIAILRAVAKNHDKGASLSKIAREVDLPIPTVKRILGVLTFEGFVALSEGSKQYYLGIELYKMSKQSWPLTIQEIYRPVLEKLAKATGDMCYLIIPSGSDGLCLDLAEGEFAIRISYGIGSRVALGVGTSGMALLAVLPDKQVEKTIWKNQASYERFGVTNEEIWKQVKDFRENGYVRYQSKFVAGLIGVAVPIQDSAGEYVASITISSTEMRMPPERCFRLQKLIKDEVAALTPDGSTSPTIQ